MLLARARRECVRAIAAFPYQRLRCPSPWPLGHDRGARSVHAGPPANKRWAATGRGRVDGPEHWAMGAAIRNGQDGPGDDNRGLLVPAEKVTASGMPGGSDPANVEREPIWLDRVTAADLMLIAAGGGLGPVHRGTNTTFTPTGSPAAISTCTSTPGWSTATRTSPTPPPPRPWRVKLAVRRCVRSFGPPTASGR